MITLQDCLKLDQNDQLAHFKEQFALPKEVIYLDGNSLGARPKAAEELAKQVIMQEWGNDLINSWNSNDWWNLPTRLGDKIGQLVGAKAGETVVTDTTSLNLFKVLASAIHIQEEQDPQRKVIIAERDSFPTDLYIIEGFTQFLDRGYRIELIDHPDELADSINEETAAIVLSHVNYRTGYFFDMAKTNRVAHEKGALVIWDLCHSIGAVAIDLNGSDADFAVGCTYKYLNGGPGSPAMLWVHPRYQTRFWQPLSGWWGHERPFDMAVKYEAASGIRRYLCGTQPIISMSLIEAGVDIFLQTDMATIRQKSLALTDLFIKLIEQECQPYNLKLITPKDHHYRGSHVSFEHKEGYAVIQALIARGVIGDYREPEVMRFGVTPLYLSYSDIWHAVAHIKAVFENREWENPRYQQRGDVT